MSGEKTGFDFTIYVDVDSTPTLVASQSNVSYNPTQNMIDVSSKVSLDESVLPGLRSETIDFDAMFIRSGADFATLRASIRSSERVKMYRYEDNTAVEWCYGYVENMPQNFPFNDGATISFSVRRTGGWTQV